MPWFEKIKPWAVGRKRNFVFVPAIFPANSGEFAFFYRKDHPIYYPIVLFSYGLFRDTNIRSKYGVEDYVAVLADSGGFQIASKGENIKQEDVLAWQMKYADAGFMLDVPPFNPYGSNTPEQFDKALEKTRHNIDVLIKIYDKYVEHYNRKDFVLYAVMQGASPEQLEKWNKEIVEPLFDTGIAKAVSMGGLVYYGDDYAFYVSYYLAFFEHMGYKKVHLLGIGSSRRVEGIMYLIAMANEYDFDMVTSDNSYASKISKNLVYILVRNGDDPTRDIFFRAFKYKPGICFCPVCRKFKEKYGRWPFEEAPRIQDKEISSTVFAHNLYIGLTMYARAEWLLAAGVEPERNVAEAREIGYERFWQKYCKEFPKQVQQLAGGCRNTGFW